MISLVSQIILRTGYKFIIFLVRSLCFWKSINGFYQRSRILNLYKLPDLIDSVAPWRNMPVPILSADRCETCATMRIRHLEAQMSLIFCCCQNILVTMWTHREHRSVLVFSFSWRTSSCCKIWKRVLIGTFVWSFAVFLLIFTSAFLILHSIEKRD